MKATLEFSDWSTHLMQAQVQTKAAEHKLLHREYDKVDAHIQAAKVALDKTSMWLATQGSNANIDVVPMLERAVESGPDSSRPYLLAAIQEITRLRGEREFWLRSGYEIGAKGE